MQYLILLAVVSIMALYVLIIAGCLCYVGRLGRRTSLSVRVKYWATMLPILAVLSATFALAEDFKTVNGKVYKNATISRVEADGIVLRTKTGISKIYFVELPKDVQERFHYQPPKAVAAQREREPIKLEAKKGESRKTDQGGWIPARRFSAVFLRVLVYRDSYHHWRGACYCSQSLFATSATTPARAQIKCWENMADKLSQSGCNSGCTSALGSRPLHRLNS